MRPTRRGIILGLVPVVVAAALIPLPVWAGAGHGVAPLIAASLFVLLANVFVPGQPMPIRRGHQKPQGRRPA